MSTNQNDQKMARILQWQNAIRLWPTHKQDFAKYKFPIDPLLVNFLEGLLVEKYGDSAKPVSEGFRRAKINANDSPFVAYVIWQAEQIEPIFREKLLFYRETMIMTALEKQRSSQDYFGYLLTGNAEESKENYIKTLNKEVAIVGNLVLKTYKGILKDIVPKYIALAVNGGDITTKQFFIVMAVYLEKEYRSRFLPEIPDAQHRILAKPSRFIYFTTETLPERVKKLKTGLYSGLAEFMNELRPAYWWLD